MDSATNKEDVLSISPNDYCQNLLLNIEPKTIDRMIRVSLVNTNDTTETVDGADISNRQKYSAHLVSKISDIAGSDASELLDSVDISQSSTEIVAEQRAGKINLLKERILQLSHCSSDTAIINRRKRETQASLYEVRRILAEYQKPLKEYSQQYQILTDYDKCMEHKNQSCASLITTRNNNTISRPVTVINCRLEGFQVKLPANHSMSIILSSLQ
jgi:hypothetical protein